MKAFQLKKLELTVRNEELLLTTFSFATIFLVFLNLSAIRSPLMGAAAFITYLLINGNFLGHAFFEKERLYIKLIFGILLLVVVLGLVSWTVMIIYNLDVTRTLVALCIVSAFCSFARLKTKHTKCELKPRRRDQSRFSTRLHIVKLLYLSMVALSFYLLLLSRSAEVHTVWEVMHPAFIPVFLAATFLLLRIIFSAERGEYKLMFIIIHSVLSHTFFTIVFPAGDAGYQARMLASTRLVFDNTIHGGWPPWPVENVLSRIWYLFRGTNFQAALSVIFARAFGVDFYWSHSLLVPVLWGIFVPAATFLITKALGESENISFLSGLLVSVFPTTIYYGAVSVPNSLGHIFFLFSLLFIMKYISSNEPMNLLLTVLFSFVSFISHFLTGVLSFSLLLLAIALRKYENEKNEFPGSGKYLLSSSFLICTAIMPLALVYQRFFVPYRTQFSLDKLHGLSLSEVIKWLTFGEYVNFWLVTRIFFVIGPLLGFLGIIYCWRGGLKRSPKKSYCLYSSFFLLGFLMVFIDYRIIKLFMVRVPFNEERLWVSRDLIAAPFVAIIAGRIFTLLQRKTSNTMNRIRFRPLSTLLKHLNLKSIATYVVVLISIASYVIVLLSLPASVMISVYLGYPRYGPLQITAYEWDAVRYIDENTAGKYVVIGDYWTMIAGQMFVGTYNPRAYYFRPRDPHGIALSIEMKTNPSPEPMIEAMKTNNATVAYFIIANPRLGAEGYNRIKSQAQQNNLQTYQTFFYKGEEKLTIFYYKISSSTE